MKKIILLTATILTLSPFYSSANTVVVHPHNTVVVKPAPVVVVKPAPVVVKPAPVVIVPQPSWGRKVIVINGNRTVLRISPLGVSYVKRNGAWVVYR